jgi:hypothetical protein
MARQNQRRNQRRTKHPELEIHSRGCVMYGPHPHHYAVYRGRLYYIIFAGRFAPFAMAETADEIPEVAERVLTEFLDRRIAELTERAQHAFVWRGDDAH